MNFVRTSDPQFAPGWVDLPKPNALEFLANLGAHDQPPGIYEIAYSYVDESGHITAMSPVVVLNVAEKNSGYSVRFNDDVWCRAAARILWVRRQWDSTITNGIQLEWRPFGTGPDCNDPRNVVKPYLPMVGWSDHQFRAQDISRAIWNQGAQAWHAFDDTAFWGTPSTILAAPVNPPVVTRFHCPNDNYDVAYSWVGNVGESEMSDPIAISAIGDDLLAHRPFQLLRRFVQPPQGALGMYLYMRQTGTSAWHRQPVTYDLSSFLWGIGNNKIGIYRFVASNIQPSGVPGKSWLCSLQKCMDDSIYSVVVDDDQITYSPVISPLNNRRGSSLWRIVQGEQGLPFSITTSSTLPSGETDYPMGWPVWLECSLGTSPRNMKLISSHADVGIECLDATGSGCFSLSIINPSIQLTKSGYTAGIRQSWSGLAPDYHGLSDSQIVDPGILAAHPIVIEGNQCLNIAMSNVNVTCLGDGVDSAAISQNNYAGLQIKDGLNVNGGRAIAAAINGTWLDIDGLFTDQGQPSYFCIHGGCGIKITCKARKLNHFHPWIHPAEAAVAGVAIPSVSLVSPESQYNGTVESVIFTTRYTGVRFYISVPNMFNGLVYNEASFYWWATNNPGGVALTYFVSWDNAVDQVNNVPKPKSNGFPVNPGTDPVSNPQGPD